MIHAGEEQGVGTQHVFCQAGQSHQQPLWCEQAEKACTAEEAGQVVEAVKRNKCVEEQPGMENEIADSVTGRTSQRFVAIPEIVVLCTGVEVGNDNAKSDKAPEQAANS